MFSAVFTLAVFDRIKPRKFAVRAMEILFAILGIAFFVMLQEFQWEFGQDILSQLFVWSSILVVGCRVLASAGWIIEQRRDSAEH